MLKKKVEEATTDLIKQTDALDRMRIDHTGNFSFKLKIFFHIHLFSTCGSNRY
jgi:hypothetical protein